MSAGSVESIQRTEVAIVGAGLAGLMAARRLAEAGIPLLVLEARDRVGGRTYTRAARDGTLLDLGGQWVGPTQHRVLSLAKELGATTFRTFDAGKNIQYRQGQLATYSGAIPTVDRVASADLMEAMLNLNIMAGEVPLEAPWQAPFASEWDSQTVATWCRANLSSSEARWLLDLAVQAIFSVEPRDLSLLHLLFYIRSAGSLIELLGVSGGAQESRFHHGAQTLASKMAEALGERVLLSRPVHSIIQDKTGVQVIADGARVLAQEVIVSIPPALAGRLRYQPALPGYRDHLTQRIPMGAVIKVQCLYPEPFWRGAELSGQTCSDHGAVRITFDNTPEAGIPGVLLGFIEGDEARIWGRRSLEDRSKAVVECLQRYFGPQAAQPLEYVEQCWIDEEYSRGGYAGYMPPGVWTAYGDALREPIGRLHWASTETATIWNGYMDGALQSGERVAAEVAAHLGVGLAGGLVER
ncbi:MAG: flavin monoamine oxidase family protein [Ktedonobacterales bacterium]